MHPSMNEKDKERARVAAHTAAFINAGGTVTQLPNGESGTILPFSPAKSRETQRKIRRRAEGVEEDVL